MPFADLLKQLRTGKGLSQSQLAAISNVPVGTIRDYEQGKREPLLSNAQKLSRALGVSMDAFTEAESTPRARTRRGKRK